MKTFIAIAITSVLFACVAFAQDYAIEDLTWEEMGPAIVTKGMVRNLTSKPVKGWVVVRFYNEKKDMIEDSVAITDLIPSGKASFFKAGIGKSEVEGFASITAEFEPMK